jgi:hypothetical protein
MPEYRSLRGTAIMAVIRGMGILPMINKHGLEARATRAAKYIYFLII